MRPSRTRAADQPNTAVQANSAKVRGLEKSLGHQLLRPAVRGVAFTETGQATVARAEETFRLDQCIADELPEAVSRQVARLSGGLSDGISRQASPGWPCARPRCPPALGQVGHGALAREAT